MRWPEPKTIPARSWLTGSSTQRSSTRRPRRLSHKQNTKPPVRRTPAIKEFMDAEGTEPEIAADVIDLVKTFQQILERVRTRPIIQVDEETVSVSQMIVYLRRRLSLEERPIRLKQMLSTVQSRQALVCLFLALLELVRLQAIQLRQEKLLC